MPPRVVQALRQWARSALGAAALASLALFAGCAALPSQQDRTETHAIAPSDQGRLGSAAVPMARQHPGQSGVVGIDDGHVAFGARMALARAAARSIDIQTFIWHNDATGTLLFDEVMRAAERGVRVRILLDDLNTDGLDPTLALLAAQPNVELRLYNPYAGRSARGLGFLADFTRLNHRMHNKSFTVDNVVAVVGGRNIADEYFEAGAETGLVDLDVIAIGEVVQSVSSEFDLFWNSASAYPARKILAGVEPEPREALARRAQALRADPATARFAEAIAHAEAVQRLLAHTLTPEWTTATVVHDDPAKTLSPETRSELLLLPRLITAFGKPAKSLDIISPYFVPGNEGARALSELAARGVQVRVLTNSLAATDEKSVHAGYIRHRKELLQAGVQLFELKPEASPILSRQKEIGRGSKAGLHAKTYAVDGRSIFVGSFNFDPRSARLNTEMGLVIASPAMASKLHSVVGDAYPAIAWRVTLGEDGALRWADAGGKVYTADPETGWLERAFVGIGATLPIEWLL
ncbi:MAG: phospholipase D family protein [Variovorax sp.]|nr:phospholipase D family protein [Variovorax sp.]